MRREIVILVWPWPQGMSNVLLSPRPERSEVEGSRTERLG